MMRLFLFWLIVPSLLFISGCSSKSDTDSDAINGNSLTLPKHHKEIFQIKDIDGRSTTLKLRDKHLKIERVSQPTAIVYLFSTRAGLCRAMLPYLSDLQHAKSKDVFVLGIVTPEDINDTLLRQYMLRNNTSFFISNSDDNRPLGMALADMLQLGSDYPLPLTVVFHHGKYLTHYEGVTPIEMIYSDLDSIEPAPKRKN